MSELIVTIDGPAAVGKSTAARLLAERLGAAFLDSGAMYRAVTLAALRNNVELSDTTGLLRMLSKTDFDFAVSGYIMKVSIDGSDVTEDIRNPQLTEKVRHVASQRQIREKLGEMQKEFAGKHETIVTEGRDQGTVVFPGADFKFFLTADPGERAKRRQSDLAEIGQIQTLEKIQSDIEKRDESDRNRAAGPLKVAPEGIVIDTTELSAEKTVEKMLECINNRRP